MRRIALGTAVAAAALLSMGATASFAQESLEYVAPGGPGSGQDQVGRAVAQCMQEEGIANVQVVNIEGGGGMVAVAQFLTGNEGDPNAVVSQGAGHVLFPIAANTEVSLDDVTPLARLAGEYEVLVIPADSEMKSVNELIERYKADPGSVTWAGGSPGATDHVFMANVLDKAGADASKMNFIPHENTGDIVISVLGGQVDVGAGGYQDFAAQVEAGELRVLAVGAPERLEGIDAPTFREEGIDLVFENWRGVSAHPSLNDEQLDALGAKFEQLVKGECWQEILTQRDWLDFYMPREEYAQFMAAEKERATKALRTLGMIQGQ